VRIEGSKWFAAPNWILDSGSTLKGAYERLVLLYLYRRAGPDGGSWPSYATIATDCGINRRSAIRSVKSLISKGFVRIERRQGAGGEPVSNLYFPRGGSVSQSPPPSDSQTLRSVTESPEVLLSEEIPTTTAQPSAPNGSNVRTHGVVGELVDLYRSIPGIVASPRDGGVIAGQVGAVGADVVRRVLRDSAAMIGAAQYPLQYLVRACRGEAKRSAPPPRPAILDESPLAPEQVAVNRRRLAQMVREVAAARSMPESSPAQARGGGEGVRSV
jgi:hypothetical protein